MPHHPRIVAVTQRVQQRSAPTRQRYLAAVNAAGQQPRVQRAQLACTNLAHGFAAAPIPDKLRLREQLQPNIAIVSSYNDMLSAHQPLERFPALIKEAARQAGATAQFAGGVPAMCDGITQGQVGMELSLFSRDVIAMATAVALSHNMFDAGLCLGVCDKIVPGLLIGALSFGHLPFIFVPAGPMPSGLSNADKARFRQQHAAGQLSDADLLEAEARAYHAPGTCTFYGTANSNQMLMEVMGLHLPGAAFVPPGTPLRDALTQAAARQVSTLTALGPSYTPLGQMVDERSIINAIVGLLATGGSSNHTLHLVAIARCAGIVIDWDDFAALSAVVPLLANIYPNGSADVNAFHAAGGLGLLIRELLDAGLLHDDVQTVMGRGLRAYTQAPQLINGQLLWQDAPPASLDTQVLRTHASPFAADGGLRLLQGNLGRAIIKVSAVKAEHRQVLAPARVFHSQEDLIAAGKSGALDCDCVAVVRFQGPQANGMPELHGLTPLLANLQDRGFKVALVTDGRMSGASGKVPTALHVTPECAKGGPLARVQDGDMIRLDADSGTLDALVPGPQWAARVPAQAALSGNTQGSGRELFSAFRAAVGAAEDGAMSFGCHAALGADAAT